MNKRLHNAVSQHKMFLNLSLLINIKINKFNQTITIFNKIS